MAECIQQELAGSSNITGNRLHESWLRSGPSHVLDPLAKRGDGVEPFGTRESFIEPGASSAGEPLERGRRIGHQDDLEVGRVDLLCQSRQLVEVVRLAVGLSDDHVVIEGGLGR